MYSETQQQLRLSLTQFFGAILSNSNFKNPSMKKQNLIALVMEELLKACENEDGTVDMIAAKPILRGSHFLLQKRMNNIETKMNENGLDNELIKNATEDIKCIITDLDKYIASLEDIK